VPTDSLETAARNAAAQNPKKEVFPFSYAEERFWLKRARSTGSNLLHHAAWRITGLPLLIPVKRQNPLEALRHESEKLLRLRRQGFPVPKVLWVTEEFFVMEDSGPSVPNALKSGTLPVEEKSYFRLFELLALLHRSGEYHGGPQLRNFTYREGRFHCIDFEENFEPNIPLETLQLRDLFLLLFSLAKDRHPVNYSRMLHRYEKVFGHEGAREALRQFARSLGPLERIVGFPPLFRLLDKDTRATYRLIQTLKRL